MLHPGAKRRLSITKHAARPHGRACVDCDAVGPLTRRSAPAPPGFLPPISSRAMLPRADSLRQLSLDSIVVSAFCFLRVNQSQVDLSSLRSV